MVWRACVDRLTYLVCVLAFMVLVLTFVMIKIVPAFRDIFVEFNLDLPPMTEFAVTASNFFVHYLAVPVALLMLFALVASGYVAICYLLDIQVLRPLIDQVFRGRRLADVLRILAVATEQREPLSDVLKRLAVDFPSGTIRGQLVPAAKAVAAGANWQTTLVHAEIVNSPEGSLLKAAERAANLPWAFRQIARRREKNAIYRLSAALQVIYPLVILVLGCLVGFFVISLFVPLVRLIQGLAV
jgi:type IV pilus assembly protein PilC